MAKYAYFNLNPKGLRTSDCVIRAFSYFLGMGWREAFIDLFTWCADRGIVTFNYRSTYYQYLKEKGYSKHKAPRKGITVAQFADEYAKKKVVYILQGKRHLTIISDKCIFDIGDCSEMIVDTYWER